MVEEVSPCVCAMIAKTGRGICWAVDHVHTTPASDESHNGGSGQQGYDDLEMTAAEDVIWRGGYQAGYEAAQAEILRLRALIDQQHEALKGYEAWEADLILNGDWSEQTVRMSQDQHDQMLALQGKRNLAIAAHDKLMAGEAKPEFLTPEEVTMLAVNGVITRQPDPRDAEIARLKNERMDMRQKLDFAKVDIHNRDTVLAQAEKMIRGVIEHKNDERQCLICLTSARHVLREIEQLRVRK